MKRIKFIFFLKNRDIHLYTSVRRILADFYRLFSSVYALLSNVIALQYICKGLQLSLYALTFWER